MKNLNQSQIIKRNKDGLYGKEEHSGGKKTFGNKKEINKCTGHTHTHTEGGRTSEIERSMGDEGSRRLSDVGSEGRRVYWGGFLSFWLSDAPALLPLPEEALDVSSPSSCR